jgi:uncharacterized protein DUF6644
MPARQLLALLQIPDSFYHWLTVSPWAKVMNGPEWMFPVVQSFHFIGFAFSIGTIAIVDLRLLGLGMTRQTAAELHSDLNRWSWIGIAMMLITGPLMFSADAPTYHYNPAFRFKMEVLTAAILYQLTFQRWAVRDKVPPILAKLAGLVSLALWTLVLAGGRSIAFI